MKNHTSYTESSSKKPCSSLGSYSSVFLQDRIHLRSLRKRQTDGWLRPSKAQLAASEQGEQAPAAHVKSDGQRWEGLPTVQRRCTLNGQFILTGVWVIHSDTTLHVYWE